MRVLLILLALASTAHAVPLAAQKRYAAGAALYEATRYEAALREFEAAQAIEPRVALIYDIALCLDRLDRREEALAAYERFLDGTRGEKSFHVEEAQRRVTALRVVPVAPVTETAPPDLSLESAPIPAPVLVAPVIEAPALPKPARKRSYIGPGALAGGAVLFGAVGAGLLGSALASYSGLSAACAPMCPAGAWEGLPARQNAGAALLGVAGAAVIGDIIWFVIEAKRK